MNKNSKGLTHRGAFQEQSTGIDVTITQKKLNKLSKTSSRVLYLPFLPRDKTVQRELQLVLREKKPFNGPVFSAFPILLSCEVMT